MSGDAEKRTVRLGYLLATVGKTLIQFPSVPYRGVCRLFFAPDVFELEDMRAAGSTELPDLWDAYWDAEESKALHTDLSLTRYLRREFLKHNLEMEIIYVEVAAIPDKVDAYPSAGYYAEHIESERRYWAPIQHKLTGPPERARFIGYDISTFVPTFNSAILASELHEMDRPLRDYLNASGLIDELDTALHFLDLAMRMDNDVFAVTAIWEVPPE